MKKKHVIRIKHKKLNNSLNNKCPPLQFDRNSNLSSSYVSGSIEFECTKLHAPYNHIHHTSSASLRTEPLDPGTRVTSFIVLRSRLRTTTFSMKTPVTTSTTLGQGKCRTRHKSIVQQLTTVVIYLSKSISSR